MPFFFRRLDEVARHDFLDHIVSAVADREGDLHLVSPQLAGIDGGLHRHNIVEGRKTKATARLKEEAEVFRVTVSRAPQPEHFQYTL